MNTLNTRQVLTILGHAFIGWILCAAVMGIGMTTLPLQTTLIIHAIAAPIFFAGISLVYFRQFHYTAPLPTALIFVGFVMLMDFFLVALVINGSLEMFTNVLGTWLPFLLIFLSTYFTGWTVMRRV
jgi:hypothetical protein